MVSGLSHSEGDVGSDIDTSRSATSNSQNEPQLEPRHSAMENGPQNNAGTVARINDPNSPLPDLSSHQHTSLFYLSLIEGRCRTQAAIEINKGRRPENHLPEDHPQVEALAESYFAQSSSKLRQIGFLPPEVRAPNLRELRRYLDTFDTLLSNLAQPESLFDQSAYRAIAADSVTSNTFSISADEASSLFDRSLPDPRQLSSVFNRNSYRIGVDFGFRESSYVRKFREIRLLGKGGFGQVYCAQHVLDGQQYAVKKIRITAAQIRSIKSEVHMMEPLLAELRALADLNHRNVVRYFGSWIETCPVVKSSQNLIRNGTFNSNGSESSSDLEEASRIETIDDSTALESVRVGIEQELKLDDRRRRMDSQREISEESGMVVFETSPPSTHVAAKLSKSSNDSKSQRSSLFYKPSEIESDNENTDTEEVPRSEEGVFSGNGQGMIIFIQMALHPMTLEDFLWSDQQNDQLSPIRHCFHSSSTARIILAILDGIEYIHGKQIVHRDLKPSNIFLSVIRGKVPPEGAVNLTACRECPQSISNENEFWVLRNGNLTYRSIYLYLALDNADSQMQVYIIPHIGDFGLIAKLEDPQNLSAPPSSNNPFKPSPLAVLSSVAASSRQPGTRFYCAPDTAARIICPKLDIYSLGIIMFEMLWEFGTKTERHVVLGDLAKGVMPAGLGDHVMEPAVKGMLEKDREKRWDCARVRQFLQGIL